MGVVNPRGRTRATIPHPKRPVAPVTVRYATEADGLRALRGAALEELLSSVRGNAEREHIDGVVSLLNDIDARLGLDDA